MSSIKKEGYAIKKIAALVWFVFCALSFLFIMPNKADAEIITYRYTFSGPGGTVPSTTNGTPETLPSSKLVLYVTEDTEKPVNLMSRYKFEDRELTGFCNVPLVFGMIAGQPVNAKYPKDYAAGDMSIGSNQTIYNYLSYLACINEGSSNRKIHKSILFAILDNIGEIIVKENGDRRYIWYQADFNGKDGTNDDTYSNYIWLYDREKLNVDFKKLFDQRACISPSLVMPNVYTPFRYQYAKEDMGIKPTDGSGTEGDLGTFLNSDINILIAMNMEMEKGNSVGNYLKTLKTVYKREEAPTPENYVWWYKEDSYDESDNSIFVDCGPTKGDTKFTFKYTPDNSDVEKLSVGALTKCNEIMGDFRIDTVDNGGTLLSVRPDYTYNSKHVASEYIHFNASKVYLDKPFHVAVDSMSYESTTQAYVRVAKFSEESELHDPLYGQLVVSIPCKELDKIIEDITGEELQTGDIVYKYNNGYTFEYNKTKHTISFYKTDDPSYVGMNMKFSDFYSVYFDYPTNRQYGLSLLADPTGKYNTHFIKADQLVNNDAQYRFNTLRGTKENVDQNGNVFDFSWSQSERLKAMLYGLIKDADRECYLAVYDLHGISSTARGQTKDFTVNKEDVSLIAEIPIRDWLIIEYKTAVEKMKDDVELEKRTGTLGNINSNEAMRVELKDFLERIASYLKPIFMFLVFFSLVLAAIYAVSDSQDPEKRVLVKIRIKNILLGVIAFSLIFLIIGVVSFFFDKAASDLNQAEEAITYDISGAYDEDETWLIKLLTRIFECYGSAVEWFISFVGSRLLQIEERELNIGHAVFAVEEAGGINLYPYTEYEWAIYMYGYKLLSSIAICLMALSIVKTAVTTIFYAGNIEKQIGVKQDYYRIVVAVLCIILMPYAFRLLLLLVNSIVLLIPANESALDLTFEGYGLLGGICRATYATLALKVYLALAVRKIMMTFMLVATPVIFGIWTFSDRFRSFDLWAGELVSNAFTQVSYAIVFFFLLVVVSTESNPIAILILLGMVLQLSDFIKDSLQGFLTKSGGIDESSVAMNALNTVKSVGKTGLNYANRAKTNTGRFMVKAANFADKNQVSKGAYNLATAGGIISGDYRRALLSGDFKAIRTKKDLAMARRKLVGDEARTKRGQAAEYLQRLDLNDKDIKELYDKYELGTLTKEDIDKLSHGSGKNFDYLRDYIATNDEANSLQKAYEKLETTVNSTGGLLSSMQDAATNKVVDDYVSRFGNSQVSNVYNEMKEDYNKNIEDLKTSYEEFSKGDLPDDIKAQKQEHIENVINDIVHEGIALSQLAVDVDLDISGLNIAGNTKDALHIMSNGLGNYDFDNVEKMDKIEQNISKLGETMRETRTLDESSLPDRSPESGPAPEPRKKDGSTTAAASSKSDSDKAPEPKKE